MFLFFPIGVEEASVDRVPVVSIGVAAICAVAFMATWVVPANPGGASASTLREAVGYLGEHPYLEVPPKFAEQFLQPEDLKELAELKEQAQERKRIPSEEKVRIEQAKLEVLVNAALEELERSTLRKWSLVPARGAKQVGWLTHMFLHFGWLHILGNLFFFYLVGPLLEDVWGRVYFGLFYVAGGLFAGFAHYLLDPHSQAMMAGASGAIAACIGAFTFRYATRRIRFAYFIWYVRIWRGTRMIPAWLWGLFWFGSELFDFYLTRGKSGVAVMAHLGGFGFGFAFAMLLRLTGVESRFVAPSVQSTHTWQQHPALQQGLEAFERGEHDAAQSAFEEVLKAEPENADAHFGLAKVLLARGQEGAHGRLERVFARLGAKGQNEELSRMARELGANLDASQLSPNVAFKVATALDLVREHQPLAESFFVRAGAGTGLVGAKAWLRAAQLRLDAGGEPSEVLDRVQRARASAQLPEQLATRAAELSAAAELIVQRGSVAGFAPEPSPPSGFAVPPEGPPAMDLGDFSLGGAPPPPAQPRILTSQLKALGEQGLTVVSEAGQERLLPYREILGIGVGAVATRGADGASRNVLFTDLVVSWGGQGGGATALRLSSNALGLSRLYPSVPPLQAYRQLLAMLFEASGASALSDRDALLRGEFPRFADLAELERACYGQATSAVA